VGKKGFSLQAGDKINLRRIRGDSHPGLFKSLPVAGRPNSLFLEQSAVSAEIIP